jgi:hypothetical protein
MKDGPRTRFFFRQLLIWLPLLAALPTVTWTIGFSVVTWTILVFPIGDDTSPQQGLFNYTITM